jgi:hypothetical protein
MLQLGESERQPVNSDLLMNFLKSLVSVTNSDLVSRRGPLPVLNRHTPLPAERIAGPTFPARMCPFRATLTSGDACCLY